MEEERKDRTKGKKKEVRKREGKDKYQQIKSTIIFTVGWTLVPFFPTAFRKRKGKEWRREKKRKKKKKKKKRKEEGEEREKEKTNQQIKSARTFSVGCTMVASFPRPLPARLFEKVTTPPLTPH
jgi:hypothetical protein